jgi:large conductance mechanosensitive channel
MGLIDPDLMKGLSSISTAKPGPYAALADAQAAGAVTLNYGVFLNTVISFLIVAFAVFLLVKGVNSLRRKQEALPTVATTKECPFCFSTIAIKATRCSALGNAPD